MILCATALNRTLTFLKDAYMDWIIALGLLSVGLFIYGLFDQSERSKENIERQRRAYELAKENYERSLGNLSKFSDDPTFRVLALEMGRIFYSYEIPDTQTVNGNGHVVAVQNNSANREARINADIEARIGHLKFAKANPEKQPTKEDQIRGLTRAYEMGQFTKEQYENLVRFTIGYEPEKDSAA